MNTIRYLHAADLHLDRPFSGLKDNPANFATRAFQDATFLALDNIIELCKREKPDFVVFAGDTYDREECSIKAQLRFLAACKQLDELHIPVLVVHGNHDPLASKISALEFPENVIIFGDKIEKRLLEKNGEKLALIHGISHASDKEENNLATFFQRSEDMDCFQLGLLHCNVDGAVGDDRYAPCSLSDLYASNLDAWALGHAHTKRILSEAPFIAYSGNTQGLNRKETGARGVFLVTADKVDGKWSCNAKFEETSAIRWDDIKIKIEHVKNLDAALTEVRAALQQYMDELPSSKYAIISLELLVGRELAQILRPENALEEIRAELNDSFLSQARVWLRNISMKDNSSPSESAIADRDDLLGEIARLGNDILGDPEKVNDLCRVALAEIYSGRRLAGVLPHPDASQKQEMLKNAIEICQNMLEGR